MAGFPIHITAGELRRRCGAAAAIDTVGLGGDVAPAVRLVGEADTVWAIQDDNDTLKLNEPITSWRATVRRITMSDGTPAPTTLGALRRWDSTAIVVANRGDDAGGDFALRCKQPRVIFGVGPGPLPSDSGAWSLARQPALDTVRIVQVEVLGRVTPALAAHCPGVQVT